MVATLRVSDVSDALEQVDGFSHAYFMGNRDSGKALSITIWDGEGALNAGVAKADELRRQGTQSSATTIESVQHYEIPLTVGAPTRAQSPVSVRRAQKGWMPMRGSGGRAPAPKCEAATRTRDHLTVTIVGRVVDGVARRVSRPLPLTNQTESETRE